MATVNAVRNPHFRNGLVEWEKYGWYPGNTIQAYSGGHEDGYCIGLNVPPEKGQSYVSQITYLKPGNHTLTFYVKKGSGSADVWVQVFANGSWQYGPSLAAQLTESWKSFSYDFTVSGINHEPVQIRLIAGSVPGFAWIDDVSIMVDAEEDRVNPYDQPTSYGKIATVGTKVRNAPNGEEAIGHWNPSAEFMILDTISAGGYDWLKTIWGKTGAYAYIRSDTATVQYSYMALAVDRMVNMALSFEGQKGSRYDSNSAFQFEGAWCQSFVNAIFIQTGPGMYSAGRIMNHSNTAQNVQWFKQRNQWVEPTDVPQEGDWVYYLWKKDENDGLTSSHVGIVTYVNESLRTISTVEGNRTDGISDTKIVVRKFGIPYSDFETSRVIGFGRPDYS